jgi:hypothetical protein
MLGRIYARIDSVLVRLTTGVVSILAMTDRTSIGLRGGLASRHSPRCRLISVRRVSNVHHGGGVAREGVVAFKARVVCPRGAAHHSKHDSTLAMDEAEIDDWLIEDILDLLNDALGG